jgi:hypothetical protein
MAKLLLSTILFLLFFASCKVIDPEETVPSFIKIDKVNFSVSSGQGSDSVVINDVWVYVDDEVIGCFELPATVPILKSGTHTITLRFGVVLNGIAATRSINPFFTSYVKQVDLFPDSIIQLFPTSTYQPSCKFIWNESGQEGFEDGGISLDSISGSNSDILKSDTVVYEGSYSGQIHMTTTKPNFLGASTNSFYIPTSGSKAMLLEINCKNINSNLGIGIYVTYSSGNVQQVPYLTINKGPNWKKIYVNMSNLLDGYLTAQKFRIFFTSKLESGNQSSDIYLDNIKLISF